MKYNMKFLDREILNHNFDNILYNQLSPKIVKKADIKNINNAILKKDWIKSKP